MKILRIIFQTIHVFVNRVRCKINAPKYFRSIGVRIGDNIHFYGPKPDMFSTEPWLVSIGNNCHITGGVRFITHDAGTFTIKDEVGGFEICGDIVVGNNVYIGEGTRIMPGVTIGSNVIIGAGSIVTKDIPDNVVGAGVPFKVSRTREEYITKVKEIIAGNNPRYYSSLDKMYAKKNDNRR